MDFFEFLIILDHYQLLHPILSTDPPTLQPDPRETPDVLRRVCTAETRKAATTPGAVGAWNEMLNPPTESPFKGDIPQ